MALKWGGIEEFSFAGQETVVDTCAKTLRKAKSLADIVPQGRLFQAISSLHETAEQAQGALTLGALGSSAQKLKSYAEQPLIAADELPLYFARQK